MKKSVLQGATCILAGMMLFSGNGISSRAFEVGTEQSPILKNLSITEIMIPVEVQNRRLSHTITMTPEEVALCANLPIEAGENEAAPLGILIADVNDYVNVREEPNTDSKIVGKLYDGCVGFILEDAGEWCKISSGTVEGYVSANYCITGETAQAMYDEVVENVAVVNANGLNVRSEPNTESSVLKVLYNEEEAVVLEEMGDWVRVVCGTKEGYVSHEYVTCELRYETAESLEEEKARKAAEAAEKKRIAEAKAAAEAEAQRQAAEAAAQAATQSTTQTTPVTTTQGAVSTSFTEGMTSYEKGVVVAEFALQYEGNPYVYGGTSLTNGADCSGFVLAVYKQFGVSLPHSANADQKEGYAVDGIENAQPGDLICYSGHIGIYIGNGQIIHASTSKTGIKIGNANYKKIAAIRRIF